MSFIDDILAKGKALFAKAQQPAEDESPNTDAVRHDRFDEWDWTSLHSEVPGIQGNIDELALKHDYVEDFFQDFYNLLHQGDPKIRERQDVNTRYRHNVDMADKFHEMPEMKSLRVSTMHDQYATALAMLSMQDQLRDAYASTARAREQEKQEQEEREKLQQMLQDLADALSDLSGMDPGSEGAEDLAQGIATMMSDIEGQTGMVVELAAAGQQAGQDAANQNEMRIRAAARKAGEEVREEEELAKSYGLEDGDLKRMSYEERKELMKRLSNNRLAAFAKLLGQFRNIEAGEVRRRVVHAPDEIVGVELGDDLPRITAGEMLNLAEPELEDDFWRRWADKELVQYKLSGREKIGRGPIIVVCDESGSMMGGAYGGIDMGELATPEAWSKAISLALCERARRDKRDFHYIGFSSPRQQFHMEFPDGRAPIEKVIEFTEHFFGGGTYYEEPLRQAMNIVLEYDNEGRPRPDIVFITDDAYTQVNQDFLDEWEAAKRKVDMRCFGILIGVEGQMSGALDSVADNIRVVSDLSYDPNNTRDIFRML